MTSDLYLLQFSGPMPILLCGASVLELFLGNYKEMALLLGAQFLNAGISIHATKKAEYALCHKLRPVGVLDGVATVKRDGRWQNIDASLLVNSDLVKLAAGSIVQADCYVNEVNTEQIHFVTCSRDLKRLAIESIRSSVPACLF